MTKKTRKKANGFSLIEVAIAMTIIGILISASLPAFMSYLQQTRIRQTIEKQNALVDIIAAYVLRNNKLPCPEKVQESNPCTTLVGIIPYRTLGISESYAKDGFGRFFTYAVEKKLLKTSSLNGHFHPAMNFCEASGNSIVVLRTNSQGVQQSILENSRDSIAFVIISHGENGTTSPSKDEQENLNEDLTFIEKPYSKNSADYFDDFVKWVSRDVLMSVHAKTPCAPQQR